MIKTCKMMAVKRELTVFIIKVEIYGKKDTRKTFEREEAEV